MAIDHCLSLLDLSAAQIDKVLQLAHQMKANPSAYQHCLQGKSIAMLFEKPSLRTRVSFDVGIYQLGGQAIYLDSGQVGPGARETVADIARNLACWTHGIVARVYQHQTLLELSSAGVPVVNALCDQHHPCQTLADLMTLQELFSPSFDNLHLAYIGDANNVCQSLMIGAAALGLRLTVCSPTEYQADPKLWQTLQQKYPNHRVKQVSAVSAIGACDVLYTDTWVSMGEEGAGEADKKALLAPFQVNQQSMALTGAQYLMHCLPAHRGEEVTSEILDAQQGVVLRQAENRMHVQKALLTQMMNEEFQ